jgi:hypothetical protein
VRAAGGDGANQARVPSSLHSHLAASKEAALHQQHQRRLKAAPKLKAALKAAVNKDVQPSNCEREGGKLRFPSFLLYQLRCQSS